MEKQEKRIISLICCMIPFSAMNIVMFNVALPDIIADFQVPYGSASWIVTVFGILYAVGALTCGKLADRFGLKKVAVFGTAMFAAGSMVGFFAPNLSMLIAARIVQGIGASAIPSLTMLIPVRFVPEERRGRALGAVAATLAMSGAMGPIAGGLIIGMFHWRVLFLFSIGVLALLPLFWKWVPDEPERQKQTIDISGAASLIGAVVCFMLAVNFLNPWLLAASAALAVLFLYRQIIAASPFIPPDLFRSRVYRTGLLAGFFNASVNFGVMLITPLMLSRIYQMDADRIGLLMFPGAAVSSLIGFYGGRVIDGKGIRVVMLTAVALTGSGLLLISSLAGRPAWAIAAALVLTNSGYILMQPALAKRVSGALAEGRTGIGMGVYSLGNFLSTAISGLLVTKALEVTGAAIMNPFAVQGDSALFSNVYFFIFIVVVFQMFLVFRLAEGRQNRLTNRQPVTRKP
jgi:Arabinose efflux permease